jgi:hypothetical protein
MAMETSTNAGKDVARCVALTQEHRGHGISTAAYYLARVLVSEGLRVLLVDVTGRRARLQALVGRAVVKNLGLWSPPIARPADLAPLLDQARRQTAGKVDVLLLDADAALLERADALRAGVDYVLVVAETSDGGQVAADRIAERLRDVPPPLGRVGVIFSRVEPDLADALPAQTEDRHLPVLGHFPADYLLAAGDDYSLKGGEPSWPHDKYLAAMLRVGRGLTRLVPLQRVILGGDSHDALHSHATEDSEHQHPPMS